VYLIGLGLVWIFFARACASEPTTHGQDVLSWMGCLGGLLWPLFLAYLVIASPWIAITWWKGER
jgi:hypothetical protein